MAFNKVLTRRFLLATKSYASSTHAIRKAMPESHTTAISRHFLLKDPSWMRMLNRSRIQLDCLVPPELRNEELSITEVRKILKAAQMETARSRLRSMSKDQISFEEFMNVCGEISGLDMGVSIANDLDESGDVIVLGNVVFLRPHQIAKAVQKAIPMSVSPENNCRKDELGAMEEKKAVIDKLAESGVKKELWCGLGFFVVQTVGLMRLTFWELSWDVMEPVCFYLSSTYFLAGYGFFLATCKEPTFESFFKSRFDAKQIKLMKAHGFDLNMFNELKKGCCASLSSDEFECNRRCKEIGVVH